jgi:hypothetical protein
MRPWSSMHVQLDDWLLYVCLMNHWIQDHVVVHHALSALICWVCVVDWGALPELVPVWRFFHFLCDWPAPPLPVERFGAWDEEDVSALWIGLSNCCCRSISIEVATFRIATSTPRCAMDMYAASQMKILVQLRLRFVETMWVPPPWHVPKKIARR